MTKHVKAYHFIDKTLRDGCPVPKDNVWLIHDGQLSMCRSGLHASIRPIDALKYAPGTTLCRVEIGGKIIQNDDKLVAEKRKIIWRIDAEEMLKAFARWCAIQVLDEWGAPDIVIKFLKTGDESLRMKAKNATYSAYSAASAASAYSAYSAASAYLAASAYFDYFAYSAYSAYSSSAVRDEQDVALKEFIKEARSDYNEWEFTDV